MPSYAVEEIGKNLQRQFETLSQKVKYKLVRPFPLPPRPVFSSSKLIFFVLLQYLDPAFEDTKKLCHQLRKTAKDERLLFYYNGHGVSSLSLPSSFRLRLRADPASVAFDLQVPAPTASGEIWVFNRNYTQYIPVSLYDLQEWLGR